MDLGRFKDRLSFRPREVAELTGLSKSKVFSAIRAGHLRAEKLDGVVLIPHAALVEYLDRARPVEPRAAMKLVQDSN